MSTKRAQIRSIVEIAPSVFELDAVMVEPGHLQFSPGQYVSVRIPGTSEHRAYSIGSAPGRSDGFNLLVRRMGGTGSQFLASLGAGDVLEFEGPRGSFALDERHPGDVVFAATGVGASPLFPMMEALLSRGEGGRVLFFWGLLAHPDVFWRQRLEALAGDERFARRLVFTDLGEGFVTEHVIATVDSLRAPTYYLCGNGQMIRDVIDGLTAQGVDRDAQIRTDWY